MLIYGWLEPNQLFAPAFILCWSLTSRGPPARELPPAPAFLAWTRLPSVSAGPQPAWELADEGSWGGWPPVLPRM